MSRLTNGANIDDIMEVVRRDYHSPEYTKRAFAYAAATILELRNEGFRTALISNVRRDLLQADAENLQIDIGTLFDFIQSGDDYEHKKPDERVFNPTLQHFGTTASRLVYIGDEMKDMQAITRAGGHFIGVETGMTTAGEFAAVGAIHVPTLKEVRKYGTV